MEYFKGAILWRSSVAKEETQLGVVGQGANLSPGTPIFEGRLPVQALKRTKQAKIRQYPLFLHNVHLYRQGLCITCLNVILRSPQDDEESCLD